MAPACGMATAKEPPVQIDPTDANPAPATHMTRRQVLKAGAVGAGAAMLPTAVDGRRPRRFGRARRRWRGQRLALWYDQSAGTDWLRALPIGNGRLGAMVFGNVDTERLQLNEDTIWAGGPHDYEQHPGRRGAGADPAAGLRQPVEPGAEPDRPEHARQPGRPAGLPDRRQPAARPSPSGTGVSEYSPAPGPDHRHDRGDVPAERRPVPAGGVRQRARTR